MKKKIANSIILVIAIVVLAIQGDGSYFEKWYVKQAKAATVKSVTVDKKKVKNGKVTLSKKTYKNVTIKNSVGSSIINLDSVTITGTLTVENNAACKVKVSKSKVANLKVKDTGSLKNSKNKKSVPTIKVENKSTVNKITVLGNINITNQGTVKKVYFDSKEKKAITVNMTGLSAAMELKSSNNADITLVTKECNMKEFTVAKGSKGSHLTVKNAEGSKKTAIKKMNVLAPISMDIDVETNTVHVDEKAAGTKVVLGSNANVSMLNVEGEGVNVSGDGKVKEVNVSGNNAKIDVEAEKLNVEKGTTGVTFKGTDVFNKEKDTDETNGNGNNSNSNNGNTDNGNNSNGNDSNENNSNGNNSNGNNSNSNGENTKPESCIITFETQSGNIAGSTEKTVTLNVNKGDKIKITDIPKAEYAWNDFLGWSETEKGQMIDFNTYVVKGNVVFKAVFLDKLQMNLRAAIGDDQIEYDSETNKMVIAATKEEAISPKDDISIASGAAFILDKVGDKTASIAVYSLNDSNVTITLTKGIELKGEPIEGIDIPGYNKHGKYYKNLPAGEYRITCVLDSDNTKIISRIFYIVKDEYVKKK